MIESGTLDEFKQSLLGNLTFAPNVDTLKMVKKSFEHQDLKVLAVSVKSYQCGKGERLCNWNVVALTFVTKRKTEGATCKALRAVRAARLSLYQFTCQGKHKQDETYVYDVELREHE